MSTMERILYIRYNRIIVPWCYRFVQTEGRTQTVNATTNPINTSNNTDEKVTIRLFEYTQERKLDVSLMLH